MDALTSAFGGHAISAVENARGLLKGVVGSPVDVGFASLIAAAALIFVPHAVKVSRVFEASKFLPKDAKVPAYQLKQPRASLELALQHAPHHLKNAIARAQGAHMNGFESYPLFAAAILAAKFAGVDSMRVDGAALTFLAFRVAYTGLYCWGTRGWMATLRSTVWFNSVLACSWLLWQAAVAPKKY